MASSDWTLLNDVLGSAVIDRGVTAGIPRPPGGGNFVYGFHSLDLTPGAVALHTNQVNYAPMVSGGSIRGAIQRGLSGAQSNYAPFFFIALQGQSVNNQAYMLGLADEDPSHIVLKKGLLKDGLDDVAPNPASNGVLLRSTSTFTPGTWVHLRLDVIVQGTGDVLLQVYQSDLTVNSVGAPVWADIPGMLGPQSPTVKGFIDDSLQINTGSAPLVGGRCGFGFQSADTNRRAFFDSIVVGRQ